MAVLLTAVADATHPGYGECRRWPLEEKSHRSREVKVRARMRAPATWGKSQRQEQISLFQHKYNNLKRQNYKGKREVLAGRGRGEDLSEGRVQQRT